MAWCKDVSGLIFFTRRRCTGMWVGSGSEDMVKYRLFHPKHVQVRHRGQFSKAIYLITIAAEIKIFFHFKLCFFTRMTGWFFLSRFLLSLCIIFLYRYFLFIVKIDKYSFPLIFLFFFKLKLFKNEF